MAKKRSSSSSSTSSPSTNGGSSKPKRKPRGKKSADSSKPNRADKSDTSEKLAKAEAEAKAKAEARGEQADDDAKQHCVVVGIGASAGGLDAFKRLLRTLPSESGVAYVLVQHLDPSHESLMAELLSKHSKMPVLQVTDTTSIEADHIYMIPPNKFIKIEDDELLLDEPVKKRGVRLPIDYFFRSLAAARKERSVCIVLSGTGSDGAAGLRDVKAEGGLTIVQDPESAEYDGMPRSAIGTGSVDIVLPIEKMADVFIPYARHPYVVASEATTLAERAPDHYRAILSLLRAHTDHDFSKYKNGTLTRRIERRMGIRHLQSPQEYLAVLRSEATEVRALFKDMLIGVTRFFRDEPMWDDLGEILAKQLLKKSSDDPFRIWVPGCSSGEEAYSLAITVSEQQERQNRRPEIQLFATDIDRDAIDIARAGVYPESIEKDVPERLLESYFQKEGSKLRVRKRLRESCVFAVQDVLSDPPFSGLDLICCRNLLIYLQPEIQGKLFELFHFALKVEGLLVLGSSESLGRQKDAFKALSHSSRIYQKKGTSRKAQVRFPIAAGTPTGDRSEQTARLSRAPEIKAAEQSRRALLEEFAPPSVVVNGRGAIEYIHGAVRNYLDFPSGEPTLELAAMAVEGLKQKVRTALAQARTADEPVVVLAPRVRRGDERISVQVRVQPLPGGGDGDSLYLVSFVDEVARTKFKTTGDDPAPADSPPGEMTDSAQLAIELQATREDLQSTIEELESANEELKASNEEVMSMNEELQSTNEELETSREELQSINEELSTVNNQLHDKVEELEATTNDLTNLLTSTDVATLFLDSDLRIRRYTPATCRVMNILDSDVGRPIDDLAPRVNDSELVADARSVLNKLIPIEREVDSGGEHVFTRRILPFRTSENRIEGVVVTFNDITRVTTYARLSAKRGRQQATIAQLGRAALAGMPLPEFFEHATQRIAETLNADFTKILELSPDKKSLKLLAGVGWEDELIGKASVSSGGQSQAGYTLDVSGPVLVNDLPHEKRFSGPALLTKHDVKSGVSVIIGPDECPWGVLGVHAQREDAFTSEDSAFVQAVANVLWEAIHRNQIEGELRDSEARAAAFLQSDNVVAWMKDEDGKYAKTYDSFNRLFHLSKDAEWHGKTDYDIFPREIADALRKNDLHVLETNTPLQTIEQALTPEGELRNYLVNKFPFEDSSGQVYVGGMAIDITERQAAEAALAESKERLRLAAELACFGTYYVDCEAGDVSWSPEFRAIVGYDNVEPITVGVGKAPEFIHEDDRSRVAESLRASLDPAGSGEFRDEHRIVRPNGEQRWVLMQGRTVFSGDGDDRKAMQNAGVLIDITERHEMEQRLLESQAAANAANEAKSQFLANVSHEIRTPMTSILGYADILLSHLQNPDNVNAVRTIKQNGEYLCEILNDILDLSKIEAGKLHIQSEPCELIPLIADVRSLMAVAAGRKDIGLRFEFKTEVPKVVHTDSKAVRQVLINLVSNAIKFTNEGEVRIGVACDRADESMVIEVVDTGSGIDQPTASRLFQPFQQADNTATRQIGGTGLGLAISSKLAAMLDGEVTLAHSTPEVGSTFVFKFATGPLDDAEFHAVDANDLQRAIEEGPIERVPRLEARILAVDDRRDVRFLVQNFVEATGAEVLTADDGALGLEEWRRQRDAQTPIDAILMDMHMPNMDGLEATRRLREEGFTGPIIALTADTMAGDREKCLQAGCSDFASKPIDRGELIGKLASALQPTAE